MLPGPKLQADLWTIITRWRRHRVVFTADVVKMYRQILVHPDDVNWQRILWRDNAEQPVCDHRLLTVTYGTASAPYLAIRTLQQLARDEEKRYPLAASALLSDAYVDDILTGASDIQSAQDLQQQLVALLRLGGFELSKWAANHRTLLPRLDDSAPSSTPMELAPDDDVRTLGLLWNPLSDHFSFRISVTSTQDAPTKRRLLSEIARLFDPLGWLAPALVPAKILLQSLWLAGISWDEELPDDIATTWTSFRRELPLLEQLTIPRWLGTGDPIVSLDLHGFCDASERAYAAVVYLRVEHSDKTVHTSLLVAKTKVAPVKAVSIPRLELCGATLLARLLSSMEQTLGLEITRLHAWTDSSVVLAWIKGHASQWKPFVANRVSEIQTKIPTALWHHVTSASNPADCASRGISPQDLHNWELWWSGPKWLKGSHSDWPKELPRACSTNLEQRTSVVTSALAAVQNDYDPNPWLKPQDYSSLSRLVRVSAYAFRFIQNLQKPQPERTLLHLSTAELEASQLYWLKKCQSEAYDEELRALARNQELPRSSSLRRFAPLVDQHGLLRLGGRLQNAALSYNEKHPVLLPNSAWITLLLVRNAHAATLHGGPQLTLSHLLRSVWIVRGRNLIRRVVHTCVRCIRYRARPEAQQMGQLPAHRLGHTRAFLHAGVDYAGPIYVRTSPGRGHKSSKAYIALFVCLATKAVHLEVVSDYTSAAFLAAFKRFVSRRGRCATLCSDNGTTFQGADAELQRLFRSASGQRQDIATTLANDGTQWNFIPPHAPHFGGLWEAGVKSVKFHLRRVIGDVKLTFEELSTVLAEIEACLNSRPLCPISSDPADLTALTPGHFLVGEALITVPEPSLLEVNVGRQSRWQLTRTLTEHFWRRWSHEYLHHLQQRSKWMIAQRSLRTGDLVLVKDDLQPPSKWVLARVLETHPGADGLVRVATVKTATTTLKRPSAKLCLLLDDQPASDAAALPEADP